MAAEGRQQDASCILKYAAGTREEFKCNNSPGGQVGPRDASEVVSGASGTMFTSVTVCEVTVEPGDASDDLAIHCDGVRNIARESSSGPVAGIPKSLLAEGGTIYPSAKFKIRSSSSLPRFTLGNGGKHNGNITMLVKLRVE